MAPALLALLRLGRFDRRIRAPSGRPSRRPRTSARGWADLRRARALQRRDRRLSGDPVRANEDAGRLRPLPGRDVRATRWSASRRSGRTTCACWSGPGRCAPTTPATSGSARSPGTGALAAAIVLAYLVIVALVFRRGERVIGARPRLVLADAASGLELASPSPSRPPSGSFICRSAGSPGRRGGGRAVVERLPRRRRGGGWARRHRRAGGAASCSTCATATGGTTRPCGRGRWRSTRAPAAPRAPWAGASCRAGWPAAIPRRPRPVSPAGALPGWLIWVTLLPLGMLAAYSGTILPDDGLSGGSLTVITGVLLSVPVIGRTWCSGSSAGHPPGTRSSAGTSGCTSSSSRPWQARCSC